MFSFFIYSKYTLKVFVLQYLNYNCYSFCIKFVIIYGSQYKQKVHQLSQAGAPYDNKYNYEKSKKCNKMKLELLIGIEPISLDYKSSIVPLNQRSITAGELLINSSNKVHLNLLTSLI